MSHTYSSEAIEASLAQAIGVPNPAVVRILMNRHGDHVAVWTVIDRFSAYVRDEVYAAEEMLMDAHPDTRFDFHVLDNSGYSENLGAQVAYIRI